MCRVAIHLFESADNRLGQPSLQRLLVSLTVKPFIPILLLLDMIINIVVGMCL
jgi:hypothetical protein